MILAWKPIADTILLELKETISNNPVKPHLAVILVWNNPASLSYIRMKRKACEHIWYQFTLIEKESTITEEELLHEVNLLNHNSSIHWIIVQSPIPKHINYQHIIEHIDPLKDVDGFSTYRIWNLFLWDIDGMISCTPKWIKRLLDAYDIPVIGKHVVILGRSNIVWKPLSLLLINAGATVTVCNSHTTELVNYTKNADIIISAVWDKWIIKSNMVNYWTIIIDVWCSIIDWKAYGDVDTSNMEGLCSFSPVPGWVGPMTVAMLMENTYIAYKNIS